MIRFQLIAGLLIALLVNGSFVFAQQANAPAQSAAEDSKQLDAVSQEAAKLEADLNKFKDTSPEAAELLIKLTDLYHQHGRAFGLIRSGQRFAAAHPSDPRNQAVMLKLIDGLEAMSRHKELTVSIRQFLQKYPTAPQVAELEERLAKTLDKLGAKIEVPADVSVVLARDEGELAVALPVAGEGARGLLDVGFGIVALAEREELEQLAGEEEGRHQARHEDGADMGAIWRVDAHALLFQPLRVGVHFDIILETLFGGLGNLHVRTKHDHGISSSNKPTKIESAA